MMTSTPRKAVIYCRASDTVVQLGSESILEQEKSCRNHAIRHGYNVVAMFHDTGSVNDPERPGLSALLEYLQAHKDDCHAVLLDEASRLARDIAAYSDLRAKIHDFGGTLEFPASPAPVAM